MAGQGDHGEISYRRSSLTIEKFEFDFDVVGLVLEIVVPCVLYTPLDDWCEGESRIGDTKGQEARGMILPASASIPVPGRVVPRVMYHSSTGMVTCTLRTMGRMTRGMTQ